MASDLLTDTRALRDRAWREVIILPQYKAYLALQAAVGAMEAKGEGVARETLPHIQGIGVRVGDVVEGDVIKSRRISHADAAASALREIGKPLPVGRLMEAAIAKGAMIGGNDPLANFRSTVSKDERFYSLMRNNMYFWWFKGEPLPLGWKETEPDQYDALFGSASTSEVDQRGGDGHGPATT